MTWFRDGKNVAIAFLTISLMGTVAGLGVTLARYRALSHILDDPAAVTAEQTRRIVNDIGRHIDIPAGEEPRIATVNNAGQLANQPFFANAQNGQKLVIYEQGGIAVLYDSVERKVVNVGSFRAGDEASSAGIGTEPSPSE